MEPRNEGHLQAKLQVNRYPQGQRLRGKGQWVSVFQKRTHLTILRKSHMNEQSTVLALYRKSVTYSSSDSDSDSDSPSSDSDSDSPSSDSPSERLNQTAKNEYLPMSDKTEYRSHKHVTQQIIYSFGTNDMTNLLHLYMQVIHWCTTL